MELHPHAVPRLHRSSMSNEGFKGSEFREYSKGGKLTSKSSTLSSRVFPRPYTLRSSNTFFLIVRLWVIMNIP